MIVRSSWSTVGPHWQARRSATPVLVANRNRAADALSNRNGSDSGFRGRCQRVRTASRGSAPQSHQRMTASGADDGRRGRNDRRRVTVGARRYAAGISTRRRARRVGWSARSSGCATRARGKAGSARRAPLLPPPRASGSCGGRSGRRDPVVRSTPQTCCDAPKIWRVGDCPSAARQLLSVGTGSSSRAQHSAANDGPSPRSRAARPWPPSRPRHIHLRNPSQ